MYKSEKPAPASSGGRRLPTSLLVLLLWSLALGVLCLYFAKADYGTALFFSYWNNPLIAAMNLLPVLLLVLFFFLLFNRVWISLLLSGGLLSTLVFINYYKLLFRGDPLVAADATLVAEAADMTGKYPVILTPEILLTFAGVLLCSALAFFLLRGRVNRILPRFIALAALLIVGVGAYFGLFLGETVYDRTSNLEVSLPDGSGLSAWSATDAYVSRGFLYPLIHSFGDLAGIAPQGYDRNEAEAQLASFGSDDIPADQKVSVISVMLESFNDFSRFGVLDFETDPYAFFHELQGESLRGQLVTNIFGGGTVDTERCYVTGATKLYQYRGGAFSYARYFDVQGYYTEFCHPGYSWFYDRQDVAGYLGFQAAHFREDLFAPSGGEEFLSDADTFPLLYEEYRRAADAGLPYFGFTVTYQNHGPYASDRLSDGATEYVGSDGLSQEAYYALNNYFDGIRRTDEALRDFIENFRDLEDPVVIVLFGDHNPGLGDDHSVYAELGIDLSLDSEKSFYNYYETPYIVWANEAARAVLPGDFSGEGGDFSPFLLMPRVFDECGWGGDGYMKACRELSDTLDVVHVSGAVRENGKLEREPSAPAAEELQKLQYLQYYLMKDAYQ
jgi:phosphoglycerol transferase MdoB-like AlkP superfamily enzyme